MGGWGGWREGRACLCSTSRSDWLSSCPHPAAPRRVAPAVRRRPQIAPRASSARCSGGGSPLPRGRGSRRCFFWSAFRERLGFDAWWGVGASLAAAITAPSRAVKACSSWAAEPPCGSRPERETLLPWGSPAAASNHPVRASFLAARLPHAPASPGPPRPWSAERLPAGCTSVLHGAAQEVLGRQSTPRVSSTRVHERPPQKKMLAENHRAFAKMSSETAHLDSARGRVAPRRDLDLKRPQTARSSMSELDRRLLVPSIGRVAPRHSEELGDIFEVLPARWSSCRLG